MNSIEELHEIARKLKAQIAEKKEENRKKDLIISDLKARLAKKKEEIKEKEKKIEELLFHEDDYYYGMPDSSDDALDRFNNGYR